MKKFFYFLAFAVSFFSLASFVEKDSHSKTVHTIAGTLLNNLPRNVTVIMSTTTFTAAMSGGTDSDSVTYDDVDGFVIEVIINGTVGLNQTCKVYTDGSLYYSGPISNTNLHFYILVVSNPTATVHVELGP